MILLLSISSNRFYDFKKRYGVDNKSNSEVPKDTWLTPEEKEKIVEFHSKNPLNGYRRLCYMMMDEDIVYCSPKSVYRVLKERGLLDRNTPKSNSKGEGFKQPARANKHWHVDVSYLNVAGTFYYLCSVLDGYSRMIIHHDIRKAMTEKDIEQILQTAREICPEANPRIITDNGPQFVAKDFKAFIKFAGMTHVKTSPYYPQSNGKIERWHREMKTTYRSKTVSTFEDAQAVILDFVETYNYSRLHSAVGYVTPFDRFLGLDSDLQSKRKICLRNAKAHRKAYWSGGEREQVKLSTASSEANSPPVSAESSASTILSAAKPKVFV